MTDFDKRLTRAIERGQRSRDSRRRDEEEKQLTQEQLKRLHQQYRLELSEHIEQCLSRLADHFPGFQFETLVGERGWGAACRRDDIKLVGRGKRDNLYSRLEMVISPLASFLVLELVAKGTIRNKKVYNRKHFQKLAEADPDSFREFVDLWVLEYAELYAAQSE